MNPFVPKSLAALAAVVSLLLAGCEAPPQEAVQRGYRGTGMVEVFHPATVGKLAAANKAPAALPAVPPGSPPASTVFKNVTVLNDVGVAEFTRLMAAMTEWVSPKEGCNHCHVEGDLASDAKYTKVVARRMLQMTRHINNDWKSHVAGTGVTCYTCHRGNPVPANTFHNDTGPANAMRYAGNKDGQNTPIAALGLSSLPGDPLTPFLGKASEIRVVSNSALPPGNSSSTQQTESTYALMMHISGALGVNCTYCHNTRSFAEWDGSTPQRGVAWHGIRMVRDLNGAYLDPLKSTLPKERLGPSGDAPKADCATCHQGVYKPLFGANMAKDYPELAMAPPPPAAAAPVRAAGPQRVLFDVGKKDLDADAMKSIELAIKQMKDNPSVKVDVSGYADKTGNPGKNLDLAKQRALAVRDAMKVAGIAESRINMKKPEFVIGGAAADSRRVDITPQ